MKYDFETVIDRTGKDAIAMERMPIEGAEIKPGFSRIPMWVADMNFATAPSVTRAIIERAKHPLFGYFAPSDAYYNAIIGWQSTRNGTNGIKKEYIGYQNGVLGGLMSAMSVLCGPGGSVLLNSPTYIGFTKALKNAGYNVVLSPMYRDENGVWRMDYEDMERKIKQDHIHAAIFCSPHNPCGRVWERGEIQRVMDMYRENDVYVVSDEIWSDIILCDRKHVPTQSVSEDARRRTIAFYAPTKTFNLAGLVGSYDIIYDPRLRDRMLKASSLPCYDGMNVLSMYSLIGAYTSEGEQWLEELRQVLRDNVEFACDYIARRFQGVTCARPEGTYMLFLDCSGWCREHSTDIGNLLRTGAEVGVLWQDGRPFHGPCAIRINLALPHKLVEEAFERLDKYVFNA